MELSRWSTMGASRRRFSLPSALFRSCLLLFLLTRSSSERQNDYNNHSSSTITVSASNRKLLGHAVIEPNRVPGDKCANSDVVIIQGATERLPNGIPTYTVEITNQCPSGCSISGIHVTCGWFSSATMVNPLVFKRLAYNDCLVNDGKPLPSGQVLSFKYATTFMYPLSVSSVSC